MMYCVPSSIVGRNGVQVETTRRRIVTDSRRPGGEGGNSAYCDYRARMYTNVRLVERVRK